MDTKGRQKAHLKWKTGALVLLILPLISFVASYPQCSFPAASPCLRGIKGKTEIGVSGPQIGNCLYKGNLCVASLFAFGQPVFSPQLLKNLPCDNNLVYSTKSILKKTVCK